MQAKRDEIAEKSDGTAELAKDYLDCDACRGGGPFGRNATERAMWNCGWLPKSERKPGLRPFREAPVCPGYLIQQPEVYEAARALSWRRDGQLQVFYDEPLTGALRDCIDILDSACKESERDHLRKQRREMSRGPK